MKTRNGNEAIAAVTWATLAAAVVGCAAPSTQDQTANAPAIDEQHPAPEATAVDVVFVPEMEPLPGVTEAPMAVTPGVRRAFDEVWERARPSVAARVTPEALAGISRWAKPQTSDAALPAGWIDALPMEPVGRTDAGWAVFGQSAERSTLDLPSHAAVVRRRLIVAPAFDPAARSIPVVFVTIRGWAEE